MARQNGDSPPPGVEDSIRLTKLNTKSLLPRPQLSGPVKRRLNKSVGWAKEPEEEEVFVDLMNDDREVKAENVLEEKIGNRDKLIQTLQATCIDLNKQVEEKNALIKSRDALIKELKGQKVGLLKCLDSEKKRSEEKLEESIELDAMQKDYFNKINHVMEGYATSMKTAKIKELERQKEILEEELASLEKEKQMWDKQANMYKEELEQERKDKEIMERSYEVRHEEIEESHRNRLKESYQLNQKEMEKLQRHQKELEKSYHLHREKMEESQKELEESQKELEQSRLLYREEVEKSQRKLEESCQLHQKEIEKSQKELEESRQLHQEEIEKSRRKLEELRQLHQEEIEKSQKELEESRRLHREEIEKSQRKLEESRQLHQEEIEKSQKELEESRQLHQEETEKSNQLHQKELEELRKLHQDETEKSKQLQNELEELRLLYQLNQEENERHREEVQNLQSFIEANALQTSEFANLRQDIEVSKAQNCSWEDFVKQLKEDKKKLVEKIQQLEAQRRSDLIQWHEDKGNLEQEISKYSEEVFSKDQQIQHYEKQGDDYAAKLREKTMKTQELEQKLQHSVEQLRNKELEYQEEVDLVRAQSESDKINLENAAKLAKRELEQLHTQSLGQGQFADSFRRMNAEVIEANRRMTEMRENCSRLERKNQALEGKNKALEDENRALDEGRCLFKGNCEALEKNYSQIRDDYRIYNLEDVGTPTREHLTRSRQYTPLHSLSPTKRDKEMEQLRKATSELNEFLARNNLPAAVEEMGEAEIPESLKEKIEKVRTLGGVKEIEKGLSDLPVFLKRNCEIFEEAIRVLDEQGREDAELMEQFKEEWTLTPPSSMIDTLRKEVTKYRGLLDSAASADYIVKDKYQGGKGGILLLDRPEAEIRATIAADSSLQCHIRELSQLMEQVQTVKAERKAIEQTLNNEESSPGVQLVSENQEIQQQITDNIKKQDHLIKSMLAIHNQFTQQTQSCGEEKLKELEEAYAIFAEVNDRLDEATKFYIGLTSMLLEFQEKVEKFVSSRKAENSRKLYNSSGGDV